MDLPVASSVGQKLCELFPYRWSALESTAPPSQGAKWRTVRKYPIKPRVLWERYNDPDQLVGLRFGSHTKYGMIDLDSGSACLEQLPTIHAALETIGVVRTVPIRSSNSGGLHLFLPLPESVPTFALACALKQCLEAQGFKLAAGQLEIFPNVKAHGAHWRGEFVEYNGHRLPLQPGTGAAILDGNLSPVGADLSQFFARWDNAAQFQDIEELQQALAVARNNHRKRPRRLNVHPVKQWRADLESEIAQGWSGPGETNAMLKAIATFGRVFEGLAGAELASYTERIAITRSGYLDHCSHQREITVKARSWANACERYYWPLGTAPARAIARCTPNDKTREDARSRIRTAAAEIRLSAPATIRGWADRLVELARCSKTTLYNHLDLWHPQAGVTAPPDGILAALQGLIGGSLDSAESLIDRAVTPNGPLYEGCSLKDPPKIYPPEGGGGSAEGGGGLLTGLEHG